MDIERLYQGILQAREPQFVELESLLAEEAAALAEWNRDEAWVFEQMLRHDKTTEDLERHQQLIKDHNQRARLFDEWATRAKRESEEWQTGGQASKRS